MKENILDCFDADDTLKVFAVSLSRAIAKILIYFMRLIK